MRGAAIQPADQESAGPETKRTVELLKAYFEGQRHLCKGICLLNAGQFDLAAEALTCASVANPAGSDLPDYLVTALAGAKRYAEAADEAAKRAGQDPEDVAGVVRLALLQWKAQKPEQAVQALRQAIADNIDSAELHFQLGTLLAALNETEEAELRFAQAVAIEKDHPDALVGLAMCLGAKQDADGALRHLERAQLARPADARIALLLSHAAQASREAGTAVSVRAQMPGTELTHHDASIEELSRLIERDPEFIEAFVSLEPADVDESVFGLMAMTLKRAIERHPYRAHLHYLSGKVLERLGRAEEAIEAAERAVDIDPRYIQALILLAKLYQQTDRCADAATRLEQTVLWGAEYADTYYLLGNLYRDTGQLERARWAYEHALKINGRYEAARKALDSLAA